MRVLWKLILKKKDANCFRPTISISDKCKAAVVFFLIFRMFQWYFFSISGKIRIFFGGKEGCTLNPVLKYRKY